VAEDAKTVRIKEEFLGALRKRAGANSLRFLDIGCKDGAFIRHLAPRNPDVRFVGVDIDSSNLPKSRGMTKFLEADGTSLPFEPGQFDIVTSFDVIEHIPWYLQEKHIDECSRVLRPGGRLIISTGNLLTPTGGHNDLPMDFQFFGLLCAEDVRLRSWFWLARRLKRAGFNVQRVRGPRGWRIPNFAKPHWMIQCSKGATPDEAPGRLAQAWWAVVTAMLGVAFGLAYGISVAIKKLKDRNAAAPRQRKSYALCKNSRDGYTCNRLEAHRGKHKAASSTKVYRTWAD
jgi:SAM-dependent methyltransferase